MQRRAASTANELQAKRPTPYGPTSDCIRRARAYSKFSLQGANSLPRDARKLTSVDAACGPNPDFETRISLPCGALEVAGSGIGTWDVLVKHPCGRCRYDPAVDHTLIRRTAYPT